MRPVEPFALERLVAAWARERSPGTVVLACVAFTAGVGAADLAAARAFGHDFVVTVLYVLPVGLAAWAAGQRAGFFLAAFAAGVEALVTWLAVRGALAPAHLAAAILLELLVFLGAAHLLALLAEYLERERETSRTDLVSSIGNGRAFREVALRELERARRAGAPLSLVYLDLDDFKAVNDRHGHAAGDALLHGVGRALREGVRAVDFAARIGGDEFALLLPEAGPEAARQAVERLRSSIAEAARASGRDATLSVGVVTFQTPPASVEEMLASADDAMYAAKRGGKNGVQYRVHGEASTGDPAARRDARRRGARPAGSP